MRRIREEPATRRHRAVQTSVPTWCSPSRARRSRTR
jgi:hypothetical protein